jgi:hypothetical protein
MNSVLINIKKLRRFGHPSLSIPIYSELTINGCPHIYLVQWSLICLRIFIVCIVPLCFNNLKIKDR